MSEAPDSRPAGSRILLVDADMGRAKALTHALITNGHTVSHAPTVVGGMRELQSASFDLLVTGTTLQRQHDGVKLVNLLLVEKKLKVAPTVIVLSDARDPAVIKTCIQAGVADYVLWSGDATAVVPRIDKALATGSTLGERLVSAAATVLGPAARVVIEKGTRSHLKMSGLEALRSEHLPELFRWLQVTVAPVLKDRLAGFIESLESAFRVKRNRG